MSLCMKSQLIIMRLAITRSAMEKLANTKLAIMRNQRIMRNPHTTKNPHMMRIILRSITLMPTKMVRKSWRSRPCMKKRLDTRNSLIRKLCKLMIRQLRSTPPTNSMLMNITNTLLNTTSTQLRSMRPPLNTMNLQRNTTNQLPNITRPQPNTTNPLLSIMKPLLSTMKPQLNTMNPQLKSMRPLLNTMNQLPNTTSTLQSIMKPLLNTTKHRLNIKMLQLIIRRSQKPKSTTIPLLRNKRPQPNTTN
ncbi:MAG: hypothetical protein ACK521_12595, partial [bacterium]